jgi:transposase
VTVVETTPRFVVNTERVAEIRAGLSQSAPLTAPTVIGLRPTPEREPIKREGRPAGSTTGRTLGKQRRDERIARYVLDGMGDDEIAVRMGVTGSSARKYILTLRREGMLPNDRLPAWRVRDFQRYEACGHRHTPEKIREVIDLREAGDTWSEVARRTGISKSHAQSIYRRFKGRRDMG